MKNILFVSLLALLSLHAHSADNSTDCSAAEDSAKARIARKELSFYSPLKGFSKVMFFFRIDDKHYEKTVIKKMKADTSAAFMTCYNKIMQSKLDSAFKCDLFRKVDSITAAYDKQGKGYRTSQFRGGQDSLNAWLNKNVKLPAGASPDDSDANIKVYYFVELSETGKVLNIKFANKTNCKPCEPVVTEALKKLPDFIPATQSGAAVKSTFILNFSRKPED